MFVQPLNMAFEDLRFGGNIRTIRVDGVITEHDPSSRCIGSRHQSPCDDGSALHRLVQSHGIVPFTVGSVAMHRRRCPPIALRDAFDEWPSNGPAGERATTRRIAQMLARACGDTRDTPQKLESVSEARQVSCRQCRWRRIAHDDTLHRIRCCLIATAVLRVDNTSGGASATATVALIKMMSYPLGTAFEG